MHGWWFPLQATSPSLPSAISRYGSLPESAESVRAMIPDCAMSPSPAITSYKVLPGIPSQAATASVVSYYVCTDLRFK